MAGRFRRLPGLGRRADVHEIEFVFEPEEERGHHVYAPDLPGPHTQGDTIEEATENAREALELCRRPPRRRPLARRLGDVRRKLPLPA